MATLKNPKMSVLIFGTDTISFSEEYAIDVMVDKDLEEEPNEAEIKIYNLSDGLAARIKEAANEAAPIEVHASQDGDTDLAPLFVGEIFSASTRKMKNTLSGDVHVETVIRAESQALNHRTICVDAKTFSSGTPVDSIIQFLIDTIGLPVGRKEVVTAGVISSAHSMTGPAFPLLQRYCFDLGYRAYILDGLLNITSVFEPLNPSVTEVDSFSLFEPPEPTSREDRSFVEVRALAEVSRLDPFAKPKKKRRRKARKIIAGAKALGIPVSSSAVKRSLGNQKYEPMNTYTEYDVVDDVVDGMSFIFFLRPDINPEDIIKVDHGSTAGNLYRVRTVHHDAVTEFFDSWTTMVETDLYDENSGNLLGGL